MRARPARRLCCALLLLHNRGCGAETGRVKIINCETGCASKYSQVPRPSDLGITGHAIPGFDICVFGLVGRVPSRHRVECRSVEIAQMSIGTHRVLTQRFFQIATALPLPKQSRERVAYRSPMLSSLCLVRLGLRLGYVAVRWMERGKGLVRTAASCCCRITV